MVTNEELKKAYMEGYQQAILEFRFRLPNKPSKITKDFSDKHIRAPQIRRKLRSIANMIKKKKRKSGW